MINELRTGLLLSGLYSVGRTRSTDILGLMRKLCPQDCGLELIRLGGRGDGGYLIPDDLENIEYCFSPGVNTISNFEDDLASRGIHSFMADYSVDGPPISRSEFSFEKKFVGASDRDCYMTLETWKSTVLGDYSGDLILQMDIEGSEYEVIFNTPDKLLDQFRIIVIEFHYLDRLFEPFMFSVLSSCFGKLLKRFHVAHIHPNNGWGHFKIGGIDIPRVMEFTFLNKRRATKTKPRVDFPHRLDADNTSGGRMVLPGCWYSPSGSEG